MTSNTIMIGAAVLFVVLIIAWIFIRKGRK
jgi:high-affinity Fe2+/Pb2+ permease